MVTLASLSLLKCPLASGFSPVDHTNGPPIHTLTTVWLSPSFFGRAQQGHASNHYDEWWLSIVLTWNHPLLFWLGVANERCIAKLPFYRSACFFYICPPLLPSYLLSRLFPPLFLCQWALWVSSSGPCNTQTSCREELHSVFLLSVTECYRKSLGDEMVPNGRAVPSTALPPHNGFSAKYLLKPP